LGFESSIAAMGLQSMSRGLWLRLLLAACLALALRFPKLDTRPMHNDEAVNAIKFGHLWEHGSYKYDPNEHHGPTLYYAAFALGRLTGAPDFVHYTENRLRAETALFGVGLLLLLPLLLDGLGRRGVGWAALFTALSPAFVFYSRYFIHEILLVFFTFLALGAGWRYWRSRKLGWALLAGAAVGFMMATKETFVLATGAAAVALFLNHTWNRALDASGPPVKAAPLNWVHMAAACGACALVWLLFFTNAAGLADSFHTYFRWSQRAAGDTQHVHPWYFYLQRLLFFHAGKGPVWSEALLLALALPAIWAGFARRLLGRANASFVRFLTFYTFLLTAFYSLLPYKTPWCLLGFWHGTLLLAGIGTAVLLRSIRQRAWQIAVISLVSVGAAHLAWQAWEQDTTYAADQRNPYVYAQTSPDLLNLVARVEALGTVAPEHDKLPIKVITFEGDCWPLPWYLRRFTNTGWWDVMPADPFAPLMIVSAQFHAHLDTDKTHLMPRYFELRPRVFLELYVEKNLWTDYLKQTPSREPE
jgi:uncharacterized protein (TIGR03663 family)